MLEIIQLNENDNVVVALKDLQAGQTINVQGNEIELKETIKRGHKLAIEDIAINENVVKYGYPIGHAIKEVAVGEHVHTHNTKTNLDGIREYEFNQKLTSNPYEQQNLTFKGYRRKNGDVGIRNELWIVPTVGCVNGVAERMIKLFEKEVGDIHPFENVLVLKHNFGCSQLGDDHENTKKILKDAVLHPNAGGVLVLGLGCENNNLYEFK